MFINRLVFLYILFFSSFASADLNIQNWKTLNGTQVYFVENHSLPVVDVNIMFSAGSVRDSKETNGVASMTNHLMFSGSAGLSEQELMNSFADIGAQVGSNFNRDQSSFSLRTLSEEKSKAIQLFKVVLQKPNFDREILDREAKRYVANIAQAETMPEAIATKKFMKSIYGEHPYGLPSSGTIDSINRIKTANLKKFFKEFYVANQADIVIVGDVTKDEAEIIANDISNGLPVNKNIKVIPDVKQVKKQEIRISHPAKQAHLYYGTPIMKRNDPDFFPLYVGNHVLGGSGFGSRLTYEIREKKGLVYSVYSYFMPLFKKGPFEVALQTSKGQVDEAMGLIKTTIQNFIDKGPSESELQASKDNIIGGFALRFGSNQKIMNYVSMMAFYNYPFDYLKTYTKKINAVTVDQIKTAFKKRVDLNSFSTVIVGVDER
ncbi:insulinase family protein [Methylophilaceae bacterium]|nr:insulinase family protein [Methylophilaceae bacterium]